MEHNLLAGVPGKTNQKARITSIDKNIARVDITVLPNKNNTVMTNNKPRKYLLVIEWNDPSTSANNKGVLFYSVCPRDGMMPEEFEKFMKEKAFPAVDDISTRATRYKAKYLLVDAEDKELDALDNDLVRNLINENLAERNLVDSFFTVMDSE